jgi:large subunit ribosomal protein L25
MDTTLDAVRRTRFGRSEAGRLRREGLIPAVLYGGATGDVESLSVDPKALFHLLHSESGVNTLIGLKVDGGEPTHVLVKEYQLDPVTHKLLHADFYRVAMDRVIRVTVPVHLEGEAAGVKVQGGMVDFVHREIVLECLPGNIPEHVAIDISELMVNDGVRVRDLAQDHTWTAVSEPEMLLVHIVPPRVEAEPAAEEEEAAAVPEAAETAEPEVIKKGKAEDEASTEE